MLPRIEHAKSGRSVCVGCKQTIVEGAPRLGIPKARYPDSYEWRCQACADALLEELLTELRSIEFESEED